MYFGLKIILRIWSASLLLFGFLLFLSLGNVCGVVLWKWIPFELSVLTLVCLCWVEIGWTKFSSIWVYNVYFCYGCKGAQISSARDFAFFGRVRMFVSWFLCYFFCKWRWWPGSLYAEKFAFFFLSEKLNSMNLLLYMAPIAVVFLLPATLIMEENVVGITLALAREDVKIIWYLLFNSSLAYFVNLTNFLVTKHTSALTLQVGVWFWRYNDLIFLFFILTHYAIVIKFLCVLLRVSLMKQ